jgi:localization factor PodJL
VLAGIEQGLAEVRDALYRLTPAENLVGFNDAIDGLAQKIDMIVAQRDPSSLQQLENAVNTLRQVAAHIASDEAVSRVAGDVAMLAEKVDRLALAGAGDALNGLEERISALADALAQRSQNGVNVPPQLETLVHSLTDKIEYLQNSRNDDVAFNALEDRIVKLVEKLDASDSRLAHLEAVERGLGDLLVQMSELRSQAGQPDRLHETTGGVETLKDDLARTQNEIEAVHGTLGEVVDRLATIERNMFAGTHEDPGQTLTALPDRAVAHAMPAGPASAQAFDYAPHEQIADDEPPAYRPQHLGPAPQLPPSMTSPPLAPAAPAVMSAAV